MRGLTKNDAQIIARSVRDLRILVLALGETCDPPWWRSRYFSDTGLGFLERLYPRSALSAAIYSAGRAACQIHDRAIGTRGAFHLFRLPSSLERGVSNLQNGNAEARVATPTLLGDARAVESKLSRIAGASPQCEWIGPRRIGTTDDALKAESYQTMASAYLNAFQKGYQAFPYFEIRES